jgi:hypothetical protein
MNQEQTEKRIKEVFIENYWDLGVYRWMNRNKKDFKKYFIISFIISVISAFTFTTFFIVIWAFTFIGIIWAGAIDHFIIGKKISKIISKLKNEGIEIGMRTLLDMCSDISPR